MILLELRYLHPITTQDTHRDGYQRDNPPTVQYQSDTLDISRSVPSIGTNVSSTCLSFHSSILSPSSESSPETVRFSTGLTNEKLYVHAF